MKNMNYSTFFVIKSLNINSLAKKKGKPQNSIAKNEEYHGITETIQGKSRQKC